ncbi:dense granule protein GRA11, partial [Toxoplasma gondii ARI]
MSHRMASRSRLLFAAFCAGGVLLGAGPPAARQSAFTVASTVAGGETGYTSSSEVESPENVGGHEGGDSFQSAPNGVPVDGVEEDGRSTLISANRSRSTHAVSAARKGSRSRLLLPAALLSALALSGLIGSSMMKKTAEETDETKVASPATGTQQIQKKVAQPEDAKVAQPDDDQVARDALRARRRRQQAAVLMAALVAAAAYGMYSSLSGYEDAGSLSSPESASPELDTLIMQQGTQFAEQLEALHEMPVGAASEGSAEQSSLSHLLAEVVDALQQPSLQNILLGGASAAGLGLLGAAAARRRRRQAQPDTPAPPPASEEQVESAEEAPEKLDEALETHPEDTQKAAPFALLGAPEERESSPETHPAASEESEQAPMPLPPAPEELDQPPMPLPPAPEDFDQAPMPVPEAPEEFDQAPMPLPQAPEELEQAPASHPEEAEQEVPERKT